MSQYSQSSARDNPGVDPRAHTSTYPEAEKQRFAFFQFLTGRTSLADAPSAGCVEVRVLDCDIKGGKVVKESRFKKTVAGWFDDETAFYLEMRRLKAVSAFATVNPVNPALLARINNRLDISEKATSDADIVCIRFLYIDLDAVRPAGISSTQEELDAALARRDKILAEHPDLAASAIWGCSGNGAWILVRLPDYPVDTEHRKLIDDALASISARYSNDRVKVDTATANPSRVMCVVGTMKCKGDGTDERPHRRVTLDSPTGDRTPLDLRGWLERNQAPEPEPAPEPATKTKPAPAQKPAPAKTATAKTKMTDAEAEQERRVRDAEKWFAKAMDNEVGKVERAEDGTCHDAIRDAASTLAGYVGLGYIGERDIRGRLKAIAERRQFDPKNSGDAIEWGIAKGKASPWPWPEKLARPGAVDVGRNGTTPGPKPSGNGTEHGGDVEAGPAAPPEPFHLTDMGNGERLVHREGENLRHAGEWKKWLVWDGTRWVPDQSGCVYRLAKKVVRSIYIEAARCDDAERREKIGKWATASENVSRRDAMVKCASSEARVVITPGELNRDPWLFNCPNGTIDLRTGELREHRREDYITQLCPVAYDPDAECRLWESTMALVLNDQVRLIRFVQRLCGIALTGTASEQILPILHGTGENGKSTILNALMGMMGPDYAAKAPNNFLMARRREAHPTELADLFGKRLVVAIETGEGARINEVLIKELTGSDPITARRMREDFWTFNPTHKVMLSTNHKPVIKGTDHAIWRRIHLIPFDVKIPADRKDKDMPEKLRAEYAGILAWCVRGCVEWQMRGLAAPEEVTEATKGYQDSEDVLAQFFAERCEVDPSADPPLEVRAGGLYQDYKAWAERGGEEPVSQKRFGNSMTERGYERKANNGIWYLGIRLRQNHGEDWTLNP